ncbi:nucleoside phosphorylase [Mycoplasmatota bacterium WC44]
MYNYPILEFDPSKSVITPRSDSSIEFNSHLIICFYNDIIEHYKKNNKITKVTTFKSEIGEYPLYNLKYNSKDISILHSPSGAPMAVGLLEEAVACGAKYVVAFGTCGVLDSEKEDRVFVPYSAVRDEGTSYHYMKPSKELALNPKVIDVLVSVMKNHNIDYNLTKTWSTDGVFRTTKDKVKRRMMDGCLTVEMECSALAAASEFRNVKFGQIFYSGLEDPELTLNKKEWTRRELLKKQLFWVAAEACLML